MLRVLDKKYPQDYFDYSVNCVQVSDGRIQSFIDKAIKEVIDNSLDRYSIRTGDVAVIVLRYDKEVQVYVAKGYKVKEFYLE